MKHNSVRQNILAILAAIIWGTGFVAQSVGANYLESFSFNAARSLVAFLFLLALCVSRRRFGKKEASSLRDASAALTDGWTQDTPFRRLLFAGGCCGAALTVAAYFQQKGMETTTSGKAGFITALYIVIVPIFSLFLKKKAPGTIWLSVALAVAGLYLLCVNESFSIAQGDFYVLLCAFCFSVQILLIDHFTRQTDGVELSCVQFLTVTLLSALGAAVSREIFPAMDALRACLPSIVYAGIFSSGVAYTLQILAQKDANPTVISLLLSLESVFATLAGALLLHDRMSGREIAGCALMFAAVILAQIAPPPRSS